MDEMIYDELIINLESNITSNNIILKENIIKSNICGLSYFFGFPFGGNKKVERKNQASFNGLFSYTKNYLLSSAVNS